MTLATSQAKPLPQRASPQIPAQWQVWQVVLLQESRNPCKAVVGKGLPRYSSRTRHLSKPEELTRGDRLLPTNNKFKRQQASPIPHGRLQKRTAKQTCLLMFMRIRTSDFPSTSHLLLSFLWMAVETLRLGLCHCIFTHCGTDIVAWVSRPSNCCGQGHRPKGLAKSKRSTVAGLVSRCRPLRRRVAVARLKKLD